MAQIAFDPEIARRFLGVSKGAGGIVEFLGFELTDASPGKMSGRFAVREELLTGFGNMHGGVLSAFCDHLLGCVCYPAMQKGQWAATTEFKINLTSPVSRGEVSGEAEILVMTRTMAVVRITMTNEGRVCAVAQGTCTIRDPRG
ncbi:MAG: PaaI family thioesterase [Pseudomonadales bacterium]|nr:PaaI family thioesterase [Pseudomonadales bacterium]